jgi:hypothetical protein
MKKHWTHLLTHTIQGKKHRWTLMEPTGTILETGSSVAMMRSLRRLRLPITKILCGPSAFEKEYSICWGVRKAE